MTPLARRIADDIKQNGAMSLATYMHRALTDCEDGYYIQQKPFGKDGDFVTAPEISQLFGEMLGAWLMDLWQRMGQPAPFCLLEMGAGRGTLMADILRTTHIMPAFMEAAQIHFIEISPALCAAQKEQVMPYTKSAFWHSDLNNLPPLPTLFVANEFFDALPIQQFHYTKSGWQEVMITCSDIGGDKALVFTQTGTPTPTQTLPTQAQSGDIIEQCPDAIALITQLAHHIKDYKGAGVIIDYGYHTIYEEGTGGDTFQAVQHHKKLDTEAALNLAGLVDLTAHVNFTALEHATQKDAVRTAYTTQGAFLQALGIAIRTDNLKQTSPAKADAITSEYHRLTQPDQMGQLFKVLALAHPDCPPLAGFAL